ncbi:MAG: cell division protein FtsL [Hyphomicrobiaceae bacterium]
MRMLSVASSFLALASAFMLYAVNYDARGLERNVYALERMRDQAQGDIAILKAERAHLARPERIEPLAREQGLQPLTEKQIVDTLRPEFFSDGSAVETGSTTRQTR